MKIKFGVKVLLVYAMLILLSLHPINPLSGFVSGILRTLPNIGINPVYLFWVFLYWSVLIQPIINKCKEEGEDNFINLKCKNHDIKKTVNILFYIGIILMFLTIYV